MPFSLVLKGVTMKNFTGLYKNSIAGILSGVFLLFFIPSCIVMATEPGGDIQPGLVQSQAAPDTAEQNSSNSTSDPSASINTSVPPTSPVNAPKPASTKTNSTSQLASVIGGLAIIVVLIYGLSWFVKRFAQGGFMQSPGMKIISSMPLGTRERIVLVDVGGKQLLLGVTASQINTLHVFEEPAVVAEKAQVAGSEFSQKLMAILHKNNTPDANAQKNSNS
jgi:flagellar protein FliO/FliZ